MRKGKTESGFEYEIDEKKLDNMELVDAIVEGKDKPMAISTVVRLLLGDEQRRKLYDHLRTEEGNVPVMAVSQEVTEMLIGSGQQGKNS